MTTRMRQAGAVMAVGLLFAGVDRSSAAEARLELEGQSFKIGSLGAQPRVGAGADVGNDLMLEGFAPALSLGLTLGSSRSVELRWRSLSADHAYATQNPSLVLEGEQHVDRVSLDALLVQRLGTTPLRIEVGYRYFGLEQAWRDAVGFGSGLATLDYSSDLAGHGVRAALGLDARFLSRLHVDAVVGLSLLRGHEQGHLAYTDPSGYDSTPVSLTLDDGRSVTLTDVLLRLRVDVTSRVWLGGGYRWESWPSGEQSQFSSGGLVFGLGIRFGGSRQGA